MNDKDCIFCAIARGDIPSVKIWESDRTLAFLDISPMTKGHALVIPKTHFATLADVPSGDAEADAACREWFLVTRLLARAAIERFGGANLLQCNGPAAGQTVGHLHLHVIPRQGADAVAQPEFVSGAGKYASDSERDEIAAQLREALANLAAAEGLRASATSAQ